MFGPQTEAECLVYATESFRLDAQFNIQHAMNKNGIDRDELAKRMGKRRQYVDKKLFAENANPSIIALARVFHAMGEELVLTHKPTTHRVKK